MSVTYDTLLNDNQLIQYITGAPNTNLYPDSNSIAIAGPIWLPRIYGKDLTAFEIASSGKIAISLNDIHTLDFSRSNYINGINYKTTIKAQSNYSLEMAANGTDLQIMMDSYSNNINVNAASNITLKATSGNITLNTSNNINLSASNNYSLVANNNVNLNAVSGSASVSANNSNMYLVLDNNTNDFSIYSSNNLLVSACNTFSINTNSNISIASLAGTIELNANSSNMYVRLDKLTDNIAVYTASNFVLVSSNNTDITSKNNITVGALSGSFKAYADSSNLSVVLDKTTDNITVYAASNIIISASNNYNLYVKSNVNTSTISGDVNVYANSSNMFMTMNAATNTVGVFASNNLNVSVSNNYNTITKSNISVSTIAGDYRLYVNNSNMFMRMSATTNNINVFSSNNTVLSASNSFNIFALSNVGVSTATGSLSLAAASSNVYISLDATTSNINIYASNDILVSVSNNFTVSVQSNINMGAVGGDANIYADSSNMYLTMARSEDTITMYTTSNIYLTASNDIHMNTTSNFNIGSLGGSINLYANNSNMYVSMAQATNNMSIYTVSNLNVYASNDYNTYVKSNVNLSSVAGDLKVYINNSNMSLVMDHTTNNTSIFTSNNLYISASNSLNTWANSNVTVSAIAGDVKVYAHNSNMSVVMSRATDTLSVYTASNLNVVASNDYNTWVKSNLSVSTIAGSVYVYANSSNMSLVMNHATNDTDVFTSNNLNMSVSNNVNAWANSNINISTVAGAFNVYVNSSNMFLTMDNLTNNVFLFSSNNVLVGSSNNYYLNAHSNVLVGAVNGSVKLYSSASNMSLVMDASTNDVSLFASNNVNVSASNNLSVYVQSNVLVSAAKGDVALYANNSNMFIKLDHTVNDLSVYASNNINITSSNSYKLTTRSNVLVSADTGNLKLYSTNSNISIVMDAATKNLSEYASNNISVTASNNYNLNAQSNINIGALAGDFKAYADGSNMFVTLDRTTDNVKVYAASNVFVSASNDLNINTNSNVLVGALAGSVKLYADGSNMFVTLDRTTDNVTVYASSNVFVSASNDLNINTNSNVLVGALAGSVKLYASSSNTSIVLDSITKNVSVYAASNFDVTANNNATITSANNAILFASSNVFITASNNYTLNAKSNVTINASKGIVGIYANNSNVSVVSDLNNNLSVFTSNNYTTSTSNNYNVYVHSNVLVSAAKGDLSLYANNSNMFITLDHTVNDLSVYASNNVNIDASNSYTLEAYSNVSLNANLGSLKLYAAASNAYIDMNANTYDTTQFTSNNLTVTVGYDYTLSVDSNINMGATYGSVTINADVSNMSLTLDRTTDDATLYSVSNILLTASNNLNVNAYSNINMGALNGDFRTYADNSNMYIVMNKTTDNLTVYTSSNLLLSASNNFALNTKSNVTIGALSGSVKLYANSSNTSVVLDSTTDNVTIFASNLMNLTASNSFNLNALSNVDIKATVNNVTVFGSNDVTITASNNFMSTARSNVTVNASKGSYNAYANDSNMYLTMNQTNNNVNLYGLNNLTLTTSNNFTMNAKSNANIKALNGDVNVYSYNNLKMVADNSNMWLTMTVPTDTVSLYSSCNITVSASNNYTLRASSNMSMTSSNIDLLSHMNMNITASNDLYITASNQLIFTFGSTNAQITLGGNTSTFSAPSNFDFFVQSATPSTDPIFSILQDKILVRGDIVLTGDINTSNVFSTTVIQESLKVQDTVITLASLGSNFSPNDQPNDGVANNGAGIVIDGVPVGFDSNIPQAYDKTLKWNYGTNGINDLGSEGGGSNESYWEMKGGAFRLSHQKIVDSGGGSNIVQDVSFSFRINDQDELEVQKKYFDSNIMGYSYKRVARFGRII